MKKLMILAALAAFAGVVVANETNQVKNVRKHRSKEEVQAYLERSRQKRFGGFVRRENSAKGKVVFLNAQKKLPAAAFKHALNEIDKDVHPLFEFKDVPTVKILNPADDIKAAGGAIGVAIVESAEIPAMVIAPENGWAIVNVAALAQGNPDAATLQRRANLELMRAFALVGGAAFLARDQEVVRVDIRQPSDLDIIKFDSYGEDVKMALSMNLPHLGVTPWLVKTYRQACQEGWAPAPTNEFQKAIWNKVHELPKNPLKLEK